MRLAPYVPAVGAHAIVVGWSFAVLCCSELKSVLTYLEKENTRIVNALESKNSQNKEMK